METCTLSRRLVSCDTEPSHFVPPAAKHFWAVDICSVSFSVPVAQESRNFFAFIYCGMWYRYNRHLQGFKHYPHIYSQALKWDLEERCSLNFPTICYDLVVITPNWLNSVIRCLGQNYNSCGASWWKFWWPSISGQSCSEAECPCLVLQ